MTTKPIIIPRAEYELRAKIEEEFVANVNECINEKYEALRPIEEEERAFRERVKVMRTAVKSDYKKARERVEEEFRKALANEGLEYLNWYSVEPEEGEVIYVSDLPSEGIL